MYLSRGLVVFLLFTFFLSAEGYTQIDLTHRYNYAAFDTTRANQLLFSLENSNYIKNNEYFSVSAEGYTLLGYSIAPSAVYYAGKWLRFQAGFNAQRYHGEDKFSKIDPLISANLRITPDLSLIMGSLCGTIHHRMTEPLYDNELQYTRPVETGLQFIYSDKKIWADVWLDWEQFIEAGDTIPEIFTFGLSTHTNLIKSVSGWEVNLPLQMLARHTGGQVNIDETPMQTVMNYSLGIDVSKKTGGILNSLGFFGNWLTYRDATESNALGIYKGNAIYTGIKAEGKKGVAMIGYWNSDDFIAPKGNPLFQSVSTFDSQAVIPHRRLLTGKVGYFHSFSKQIHFSFMFEGYFDIPNSQFDYAYGIHLAFNPNVVIAKIPIF